MTLVPNIQNKEKWIRHFNDMADGRVTHSNDIYTVRGKGAPKEGGRPGGEEKIKIVSPTAQAVDMAKAEASRERSDDENAAKIFKAKARPAAAISSARRRKRGSRKQSRTTGKKKKKKRATRGKSRKPKTRKKRSGKKKSRRKGTKRQGRKGKGVGRKRGAIKAKKKIGIKEDIFGIY